MRCPSPRLHDAAGDEKSHHHEEHAAVGEAGEGLGRRDRAGEHRGGRRQHRGGQQREGGHDDREDRRREDREQVPGLAGQSLRVGTNQRPIASANVAPRLSSAVRRPESGAGTDLVAVADARAVTDGELPPPARLHASLEADRAAADRPVVTLDHVLPPELVLPLQPLPASRSSGDRARDVAAGSEGLAAKLAEDLVTALIGPHALARPAGQAVGEPDGLTLEPDAEASLAGEQERSGQAEDGCLVAALQLESVSRA